MGALGAEKGQASWDKRHWAAALVSLPKRRKHHEHRAAFKALPLASFDGGVQGGQHVVGETLCQKEEHHEHGWVLIGAGLSRG